MSPIVLIAIVAILILLFILGVGIIFLLRRRRTAPAAPPPKSKPTRRVAKPAAKTDEAAAEPAPVKAPTPVANTAAPPPAPFIPVSQMEHPVPEGEKIRILIVDDNAGTQDNVSRLLYFEKDLEVIGQAGNGRIGIDMAVDLKPHIVLMDINMPDMDGITATKEMAVKAPYSQVIIMSVQAEPHYMKQAMAAGARDFQPKPFTADELISCIRRVYDRSLSLYRQFEALNQMQTQPAVQASATAQEPVETGGPAIAVYSPKGGIGTSTIAVNLAVALQQHHGDTVLVDADLQFGDISVHLNTKPLRTMSDAIHDGDMDTELLPELMLAHNSGVKLLLCPPQPELADAVTPKMLADMVKDLKRRFKAVVIDTASQLNDKTLSILDHVDFIVLVTTPELPAIKSAKLFLELAPQLEISPDQIEVVMNRSTLPGGVPVDKIERVLKISRSYSIPLDPRIHTAINRGVSVIQQDSGAPSAKAIMHLANALWAKIDEARTAPVEEQLA